MFISLNVKITKAIIGFVVMFYRPLCIPVLFQENGLTLSSVTVILYLIKFQLRVQILTIIYSSMSLKVEDQLVNLLILVM